MNMPLKNAPDKTQQSLESRARAGHYELLQLLVDLEIALADFLRAPAAPNKEKFKTFGQRLRETIKRKESFKTHEGLIVLRNLLAHAKVSAVLIEDKQHILMRVADLESTTNARLIADDQWKAPIKAGSNLSGKPSPIWLADHVTSSPPAPTQRRSSPCPGRQTSHARLL